MDTIPNQSATITREIFATLRGLLPPPVPDTAEARADREENAMAFVAALHPADAYEANLATQIVAADAHAKESLRLAVQPGQLPEEVRRCHARAAVMMRHMQSGLRMLRRDQVAREKAETAMHPAAMERAGYWFRDASVPSPNRRRRCRFARFEDLTEAERYAIIYPDRARRIRAAGGLPKPHDFGAPEPAIVQALIAHQWPANSVSLHTTAVSCTNTMRRNHRLAPLRHSRYIPATPAPLEAGVCHLQERTMANVVTIEAEARTRAGKGAARATRREGKMPGVIYGAKQAPSLIALDPRAVLRELQPTRLAVAPLRDQDQRRRDAGADP